MGAYSSATAALADDFVVGNVLGRGGFAVVFEVRDARLKRDLAVNVLNPDIITASKERERFQREAETVGQLSHPNIIPLYFVGHEDQLLYLAMPCMRGGSLADRLKKSGPPPANLRSWRKPRFVVRARSALATRDRDT